ncbi:MAG: ribonuclease HII [Anaerolineales bacterium]|nr:ribonuclease HII [Anaerolineales bacterium]
MPDLALETAAAATHALQYVAGLDEAGRGALAGPVVAAAVILPLHDPDLATRLQGVDDSKKLTARQRERLFDVVQRHATSCGIGQAEAAVVDALGILPATRLAMQAALAQLAPQPEYLLIDGRIRLRHVPIQQAAIVRGDGRSLSIAAASILAKVTRDRLMVAHDAEYPLYGFAQHKGYGTEFHRAMLAAHGPCPIHRRSFAPLRPTLI